MKNGKLRIISGAWRGRTIRFNPRENIRPTTDYAREMLFNWLRDRVEGARCLDLFAGSGALGYEALSRGAASVVFVDSSKECTRQLSQTKLDLEATNARILNMKAIEYLKRPDQQFDIVFLDPPFYRNLLEDILGQLKSGKNLVPNACVYIESDSIPDQLLESNQWTTLKLRKSGTKQHILVQLTEQATAKAM